MHLLCHSFSLVFMHSTKHMLTTAAFYGHVVFVLP